MSCINLNDLWVSEYSLSQKTGHITTLEDALRQNNKSLFRMMEVRSDHGNDFSILGVFGSYEEAKSHSDNLDLKIIAYKELMQAVDREGRIYHG